MIRNTIASMLVLALAIAPAGCGGEQGGEAADESQMEEAAGEQMAQETGAEDASAEEASGETMQAQELPEGVTQAMVEQGREIFTGPGICYTCHGQNAKGTSLAPDLTDDEWLNVDGSYDQIVELVKTGVPEPVEHPSPMLPKAGTNISDEQVNAVAAYVWTLSHGGSGGG